jgi:glycosyltransferase involved in cell wall biosynthesis
MKTPEVSVIIAAYNAQQYVEQAVRSVLEQTFQDLEVLIVDDGSTDGTTEIIRQLDDPRVRIFRQANAGQTIAKNRGIHESTGRYVGFCDADDRWHPHKLEKQLPVFGRSDEIAVVYSSERSIDEHGNSIPDRVDATRRGRVLDDLFVENFVPFGTVLVRRSCLLEVGGFDESLRMGIDWDLWLRIAAKYEFDYVPDDLSIYRKWSGQMSTNWRGRYDSAFRIMEKFQREHPGLLERATRRRAYANTYTNRGRARASSEPLAGMIDTLHGLFLDPFTRYSWKSPIMVLRTAASGLRRETDAVASK